MKLLAFCLLLGMSAQAQVTNLSATTEQPRTFIAGWTITDYCSFGQKIEILRKEGDKETLATCGTDGKWWKFRDETDFAQAAQRAADETDGKPPNLAIFGVSTWDDGPPHKPWDEVDGMDWPRKSVPADPVDVPAVHHEVKEISRAPECWDEPYDNYWRMWRKNGDRKDNVNREGWPNLPLCDGKFPSGTKITYTCTDKSRVLLTSEDGKKHCIKF